MPDLVWVVWNSSSILCKHLNGAEIYKRQRKVVIGDTLRSKTQRAMVNESAFKILCHNIVVLIHEMDDLGINPGLGDAH
jgi:hypothetical protein